MQSILLYLWLWFLTVEEHRAKWSQGKVSWGEVQKKSVTHFQILCPSRVTQDRITFPSKEQWRCVESVVYKESSLKSVPRVLNWGWLYRLPLFRGGTTVNWTTSKNNHLHSSNISIWYIIFCTCWWISFATVFEYFSVDITDTGLWFLFYVHAVVWFWYGWNGAFRMSREVLLLLLFWKYLGV